MPQSYTLIPPYYLLLVSYVYIFGLVGLAIFTNSLATQWKRRNQCVSSHPSQESFSEILQTSFEWLIRGLQTPNRLAVFTYLI